MLFMMCQNMLYFLWHDFVMSVLFLVFFTQLNKKVIFKVSREVLFL